MPCYDGNGNITEYVTTNGTIAAHYKYSPFGEIKAQSGSLADAFTHRFSTKPWCAITKLCEYELRKYRPNIGRWINKDPILDISNMILGKLPSVFCSEEFYYQNQAYIACNNDFFNEIDLLGLVLGSIFCSCSLENSLRPGQDTSFKTMWGEKCSADTSGITVTEKMIGDCWGRGGFNDSFCKCCTCTLTNVYVCRANKYGFYSWFLKSEHKTSCKQ